MSVAGVAFKPPNGLLAGAAAGLGENKFEAPDEPPKRFFWGPAEELLLKEGALGFASGDICMDSEAAFAGEPVAACPKTGVLAGALAFCCAPKRPFEKDDWVVGGLLNPPKLVDAPGVDWGAGVAALKENGLVDGAELPKPEDEKLKPVEPVPPNENGVDAA